jgi:hypothetical protein
MMRVDEERRPKLAGRAPFEMSPFGLGDDGAACNSREPVAQAR